MEFFTYFPQVASAFLGGLPSLIRPRWLSLFLRRLLLSHAPYTGEEPLSFNSEPSLGESCRPNCGHEKAAGLDRAATRSCAPRSRPAVPGE